MKRPGLYLLSPRPPYRRYLQMQKQRLLICDDEEGVRESLTLILSGKYDLTFAENGQEAIQALKSSPDIKAVLLDIKMPGKNGLDVLKEIKSFDNEMPVIIVTGYQSVEAAVEATKAGACDYITKPLQSKSVLEIVQEVFQ